MENREALEKLDWLSVLEKNGVVFGVDFEEFLSSLQNVPELRGKEGSAVIELIKLREEVIDLGTASKYSDTLINLSEKSGEEEMVLAAVAFLRYELEHVGFDDPQNLVFRTASAGKILTYTFLRITAAGESWQRENFSGFVNREFLARVKMLNNYSRGDDELFTYNEWKLTLAIAKMQEKKLAEQVLKIARPKPPSPTHPKIKAITFPKLEEEIKKRIAEALGDSDKAA